MFAECAINQSAISYIGKSIVIKDYVWVGIGAILLKGATIGKGTVLTKSVTDYAILADITANLILERNKILIIYAILWCCLGSKLGVL